MNLRALALGSIVGFVVITLAVVVIFGVLGNSIPGTPVEQSAAAQGDEPPRPDAEGASRTLTYLEGEGAVVLTMHRSAQEVASGVSVERCREVAATLDRDAPPDQMLLAISRVPDEPLHTALDDERVSLGAMLTACAQGSPTPQPDDDVAPLGDITARVQQRLDALEEAR